MVGRSKQTYPFRHQDASPHHERSSTLQSSLLVK
jgi:hypothetical protein